jgi:DNA-directed RNA polymerase subunit RPC12/RpoP
MIGYSCPQCRTPLQATEDRIGTTNPCPRCGAQVQVPASSESSNKTLFIVLGVVGGVLVLGFMLCCVGLFAIQLLGRNASTTFQTVGQSIGSST